MSIRTPQNPGIGGLDELTNAEEAFVTNLAGLSYTQGDILFYDGSKLNVDNSNLFWDNANNRLGIGTNAPSTTLDINGSLSLKDNKKLYFDTAKSRYLEYSTDHGELFLNAETLAVPGNLWIYGNTLADGSGSWEPFIEIQQSSIKVQNTTEGLVGRKYFGVIMTDGMRIHTTGNAQAVILADNIATTNKTFQFPNSSGTFIIGEGVTGGQTLIGGTATTDDLTLQTTSGVGATGADMHFLTGNNGATEAMTILNNGNVGIGTSTPDTKLQVVGDTKLGDDNTNYALFASDGELTLTGTARVVRHLRVGAGSLKLGASSPTAGLTGVFPHLSFAHTVNQEAHFQVIVPHRWDTSTDIEICFDWLYTGAQDNGTVKWGLEYNSIKEDEDPTTGSVTISNASPGTHTTGKIVRTCLTDMILASNLEAEDTFGVRLFRDQANDTLGTGAILIGIHFHMIQNKLGKAT